jgi:hypothetical protein
MPQRQNNYIKTLNLMECFKSTKTNSSNMKKLYFSTFLVLCYVSSFAQTHKIKTDVYFSMSSDSSTNCYYANVNGCRLYKITLEIIRDSINGVQSIQVVDDSLKQVLPHNVPSAMPGVNSDGTKIGFTAAGAYTVGSVNFSAEKLYTFDTNTGVYTEITDGSSNGNMKGKWVKWLNDTTLIYTSPNYCQIMGVDPGCGNVNPPTQFNDLRYVTGDFSSGNISQDYVGMGDTNPYTGIVSKICSAQDPVFNPQQNNLVAFHSTASDGYANNGGDNDCPFTIGLSNVFQSNFSDPKPVVFDINSTSPFNQVDSLTEGSDYWLFDLDSVKINSLVHLHWNKNGNIIIGNEQNTVSNAYYECINNPGVQVPNPGSCPPNKSIQFERVYGFEKVGNIYKNVMRSIGDTLPLFQPLSPQFLPNSSAFFNPSTDECAKYRTKYVEFCGSDKSIVGTVMCSNPGGNLFSRIMFIDYTNYNNPYYFDITGWIEQNYPSWSPGNAEGIATVCRIEYDSLISTVSINENQQTFDFLVYPNPAEQNITIKATDITEITLLDLFGRVVYQESNSTTVNLKSIDMSTLNSGIYFLKVVNSKNQTSIKKIIKN